MTDSNTTDSPGRHSDDPAPHARMRWAVIRRAVHVLSLAWLLMLPQHASAQSVALSFDDGFDVAKQPRAAQWNAMILRALADAHLQSMLFPAGNRVDSPEGLALVRSWGNAGHRIANHTYAHRNLNAAGTTAEAFIADASRAQALLEHLPGWTPRLRFPYLKEGDTAAKRDAVRAWLRREHYRSGTPSIDASDWYYNQRWLAWRERSPDGDRTAFRQAYLDHLWARAQYYDGLSRQLFERSAPHVLLLHTNALNAEFLPDVIAMFRSRGWRLISPERAYRDRLYRQVPDVVPAGESILWSLAKQRGIQGLRYPAEDEVYEKPLLDRAGL